MENKLTFRYAVRKDIPLILQFIRDLAEYEKQRWRNGSSTRRRRK